MDREEAKKAIEMIIHTEVMQAYVDGEQIEIKAQAVGFSSLTHHSLYIVNTE